MFVQMLKSSHIPLITYILFMNLFVWSCLIEKFKISKVIKHLMQDNFKDLIMGYLVNYEYIYLYFVNK